MVNFLNLIIYACLPNESPVCSFTFPDIFSFHETLAPEDIFYLKLIVLKIGRGRGEELDKNVQAV